MFHNIQRELVQRPVKVFVIGAGGTGSHVLTGLAQLHHAMLALGHPGGLDVKVCDGDVVSPTNVGRQMFFPSDIGRNKAEVLVQRLNMAMGLNWQAIPEKWDSSGNEGVGYNMPDLIIGCVDNRATRRMIASLNPYNPSYWLDMGNAQNGGQVILGQVGGRAGGRLPHVGDLYPEAIDPSLDGKDDSPSCSMAEALEKQSLFINRAMALYGLNLLAELFRHGKIDYHGVFVSLKTARTTPLKIDPEAWRRMGYAPEQKKAA